MAGEEAARSACGRTQQAVMAFDCRDISSVVRVPTLLLHRRGDRVAINVEAARRIAGHIRRPPRRVPRRGPPGHGG